MKTTNISCNEQHDVIPHVSSGVETAKQILVRIDGQTEQLVAEFYELLQATYPADVHPRRNEILAAAGHPQFSTAVDVEIHNGEWAAISQLAQENGIDIEPIPSVEIDRKRLVEGEVG